MTIRYQLHHPERGDEIQTVDLPTFDDFRKWLGEMGVGGANPSKEIIEGWKDVYLRLGRPNFNETNFAIASWKRPGVLAILGRDE